MGGRAGGGASGGMGSRSRGGGKTYTKGDYTPQQLNEIYGKAVSLYRTGFTTFQNYMNGDPSTSKSDVMAVVGRLQNAYKWSVANGMGKSFEYAANNIGSKGIGLWEHQKGSSFYDAVISGAKLFK